MTRRTGFLLVVAGAMLTFLTVATVAQAQDGDETHGTRPTPGQEREFKAPVSGPAKARLPNGNLIDIDVETTFDEIDRQNAENPPPAGAIYSYGYNNEGKLVPQFVCRPKLPTDEQKQRMIQAGMSENQAASPQNDCQSLGAGR